MKTWYVIFTILLFWSPVHADDTQIAQKSDFVLINDKIPTLTFDIRYFGENNFLGVKVDGYEAPYCYLSAKASEALERAAKNATQMGYTLKIFDCYRPQGAVNHFVRWAKDESDTKMKEAYYPNIKKGELFDKGYIAKRSGHSRGSTIDLTIVTKQTGKELDMGTSYDFLDPLSHTETDKVSSEHKKNRLRLKEIMETSGFKNYWKEWWHFSLMDEPYPNTYFHFPIK